MSDQDRDPRAPPPALLEALVELFAERVAERVVEKLRSGDLGAEFIDQSESPLGRRRHIRAIRSGELPGKRVGRRYVARTTDVEAFVAGTAASSAEPPDEVDQLAAELGLARSPK